MKIISDKLHVCWLKDVRWDKTIYKYNIFYRFGHIAIITKK